MSLSDLLGDEIEDVDEEHFLLFSAPIPSSNLGFLSSTSATLDLTVAGVDLTIHQSPGLLSSNAASGTTGAVLWKITPLVAEWLTQPDNFLFAQGLLTSDGSRESDGQNVTLLELGCGIAGVIALTLKRRVAYYMATDLDYVLKGLRRNLVENGAWNENDGGQSSKSGLSKEKLARTVAKKSSTKGKRATPRRDDGVISMMELDWTLSSPELIRNGLGNPRDIDLILACDCIYNESLVEPFVQCCVDASLVNAGLPICLVAQQLRSDLVFESWLNAFHRRFHVWRIPDLLLSEGLREGSGYVVHVGVLRERS